MVDKKNMSRLSINALCSDGISVSTTRASTLSASRRVSKRSCSERWIGPYNRLMVPPSNFCHSLLIHVILIVDPPLGSGQPPLGQHFDVDFVLVGPIVDDLDFDRPANELPGLARVENDL